MQVLLDNGKKNKTKPLCVRSNQKKKTLACMGWPSGIFSVTSPVSILYPSSHVLVRRKSKQLVLMASLKMPC